MYTLGIPNRQYRRCTQVLGHELAEPVEYNAYKQDDGFWQFSFPDVDEYDFRDIVNLLKVNGITTIGADNQLTEKNIMKLSKLIKEQGSPDENELLDTLKNTLKKMEDKPNYRGGGFEGCELADHYLEELREIIEDYEEEAVMNRPSDLPAFGGLNEIYNSLIEQESPDRDTSQDTTSGEFNVEVPVADEDTKVKIKYGHATGPVDDVTISWGEESHNVDFEAEDVIDDHGNEGKDMTFVAYSQDDKWRFIVDVSVGFNYENSGEIQDVDWDTLEIDIDDAKRTDEGTCGYGKNGKPGKKPAASESSRLQENWEKRQLLIRAGIIK